MIRFLWANPEYLTRKENKEGKKQHKANSMPLKFWINCKLKLNDHPNAIEIFRSNLIQPMKCEKKRKRKTIRKYVFFSDVWPQTPTKCCWTLLAKVKKVYNNKNNEFRSIEGFRITKMNVLSIDFSTTTTKKVLIVYGYNHKISIFPYMTYVCIRI